MSTHEKDLGHLDVLVIFADEIYARGLQVALAALPEVRDVRRAAGIGQARRETKARPPDIVLLDCELAGARHFARDIVASSPARLLLCTRSRWSDQLGAASEFASGILTADAITPNAVSVAARAINNGLGVIGIDLMRDLSGSWPDPSGGNSRRPRPGGQLTVRERAVMSLLAQGMTSSEIAERLNCSERTVKKVLQDTLTKLRARNRVEAVAIAVRRQLV